MRERAVFIGSISVWDTIGTLPPSYIEIVKLFRPVYCCVMGRKAPRKRLACRVMCTPHGCSAEHPNVSRRSAHPSFRVSEAKVQTPGAKNAPRERGGVVRCQVFQLVRIHAVRC